MDEDIFYLYNYFYIGRYCINSNLFLDIVASLSTLRRLYIVFGYKVDNTREATRICDKKYLN